MITDSGNGRVIIVGQAQFIAQWNPSICFTAAMAICAAVGIVLGSIRSLQRLGWLCNLSVWMNVASFLIVMIACANYGIDYSVITNSTLIKTIGPIKTFAGPPPDSYQQAVYGKPTS